MMLRCGKLGQQVEKHAGLQERHRCLDEDCSAEGRRSSGGGEK